jgi:hypothetical protein
MTTIRMVSDLDAGWGTNVPIGGRVRFHDRVMEPALPSSQLPQDGTRRRVPCADEDARPDSGPPFAGPWRQAPLPASGFPRVGLRVFVQARSCRWE